MHQSAETLARNLLVRFQMRIARQAQKDETAVENEVERVEVARCDVFGNALHENASFAMIGLDLSCWRLL
jgi:hypothetical protein